MAANEYREEPGILLDTRNVEFQSGATGAASIIPGRDGLTNILHGTEGDGTFIELVTRDVISAQRRSGRVVSNSSVHVGTSYTSLPGYPLKRNTRVLTLNNRKRIAVSAVTDGEET